MIGSDGEGDAQSEPSDPVRRIPGDAEVDSPEEGIALCLSGGGYRAAGSLAGG
jgi:hypothetical protein